MQLRLYHDDTHAVPSRKLLQRNAEEIPAVGLDLLTTRINIHIADNVTPLKCKLNKTHQNLPHTLHIILLSETISAGFPVLAIITDH